MKTLSNQELDQQLVHPIAESALTQEQTMNSIYREIFELESLSFDEKLQIAVNNAKGRLYLKIHNSPKPIDRDGKEIILGLEYNLYDSSFNEKIIEKLKAIDFNKYGGCYFDGVVKRFKNSNHVSRCNNLT